MKKGFIFLLVLFFLPKAYLIAQQPLKVAVFAPLYLDSAFDGEDYKLGNNNIPKVMLPGLDFYHGVMMALDSLKAENKQLEVLFYDSKGKESIYTIIRKPEFSDINMIIAAFNNKADVKPLSEIAQNRKIPLISSTYPNDGGIISNPYFVMINTSLKTHIEQLYQYTQRNFPITNVIYVKRKGQLDDLVQYYFTATDQSTPSVPIKYKAIELSDTATFKSLEASLDSNKKNTIICGSLNEAFGLKLVKMLSFASKSYECTAVGMPTWDGIKELESQDCKGVMIIYTTPYNFPRNHVMAIKLSKLYKQELNAKPTDMFYKGYESMFHFGSLLIENPTNIMSHLSDKNFKIFNEFDIQIIKNKPELTIKYLENKKLYFIKKLDNSYR